MNRPWVHTRPLPPASLLPPLPCPRVSQGPGLSSLGQAVVKWNGGLLNRRLVAEKGRTWASEVKPSSVVPPSKACSPAPPCLSARDDSAPFSFVRCRSGPWCSSQGLLSASLQNSSELLISWNSRLRSWDVWTRTYGGLLFLAKDFWLVSQDPHHLEEYYVLSSICLANSKQRYWIKDEKP